MKTQAQVDKEIHARLVLMKEARLSLRLGLSAQDFIEICLERPDDAQNWEVWAAADLLPEVIEHIAAMVWTFRR